MTEQPAAAPQSPLRCTHLAAIPNHGDVLGHPPTADGCEDCLRIGSGWRHLRRCLTCGKVACCDDSPNRHARAHATEPGHPLVQSFEPGEDWVWCYPDESGARTYGPTPSPSHS